jgi:hypothetical protein
MRSWQKALLWSAALGLLGGALVLTYPDSYQQDGGQHYLFARWAFFRPHYFVRVWARPLFQLLYAPPAQLGYRAAKFATVIVCLATGWNTFRLSEELGLSRPHLSIPLLWLQPSWLLLCHELMTEPVFALVFVVALRLHHSGRLKAGAAVASLMPLARPEGFFVGILWGVWLLLDRRDPRPAWKRLPSTLLLACGCVLWTVAAYLITGDPLYVLHDWPKSWLTNGLYGTGPFWGYALRLHELAGPVLLVPFLLGLLVALRRRQLWEAASAFVLLLLLHSAFRPYGMFGTAGYIRYLVCVSPAVALLTLTGWNILADTLPPRRWGGALGALVLLPSALAALIYVDAAEWSRDAWAVDATVAHFREAPRPVSRFIGSQRYMVAVFDDSSPEPRLYADRERNLQMLREAPAGTLVMWDADTGPRWAHLSAQDIQALGYTLLREDSYVLPGKFLRSAPGPWFDYGYGPLDEHSESWTGFGGPRSVRLFLLYKER